MLIWLLKTEQMKEFGVTDGSNHYWYASCNYVSTCKAVSKMSKSKQKGTLAETAVADYLKQTFPAVERRTLSGKNDKGDIAGVPDCVVEVKNQRTYKIQEWMKETEIERINAEAELGILVIKPVGIGVSRVSDWWAVVSLETITSLIEELRVKRLQSQTNRGD
jgi:hypothetical protein